MVRKSLAALILSLPLTALSQTDSLDEEWGDSWDQDEAISEIPVVLTATRLRQSQLDTPASVTIIEAELIERMGIRTLEEIFRLVPGMLVANDGTHGGKQTTVTYHGTQPAEHRRLQVLVDGRSVYKPALPSVPRVSWTDLPLAIEDIQRIEVIRGPNSAAYGANSYLGIINILTKRPEDMEGVRAKFTRGSNGIRDYYVNKAGKFMETDYRLTVSGKSDDGFDLREYDDPDNEGNTLIERHRDSRELDQISFRSNTKLMSGLNFEFQAGYKDGVNQQRDTESQIDYITPQDIEVEDTFVWARLHQELSANHQVQYQTYYQLTDRIQEWNTCLGAFLLSGFGLNPDSLGVQNSDYCADANLNGTEERFDIELQDTYTWNQHLRTVAGFRLREEKVESETYLDGRFQNVTRSIFGNAEIKITEDWVANLGVSWEDDDYTDDFTAPRVAINRHLGNNQVLRLIYSEAVRSPNIFEIEGQQLYRLRNVEYSALWQALASSDPNYAPLLEDSLTVPQVEKFSPELSHEKIRSHEISYFALLMDGALQLDVKVFRDDLDNLMSESLGGNKPLTNSTSYTLEGWETQIKWKPNSVDEIHTTYAYINPTNEKETGNGNINRDLRLMAMHSGSFTWLHHWSPVTSSAFAYYLVDDWNENFHEGPYDYERVDLNLSHSVHVTSDVDLRLSATVEYRLDDDPLLWPDNQYEDKEKYFVSTEIVF